VLGISRISFHFGRPIFGWDSDSILLINKSSHIQENLKQVTSKQKLLPLGDHPLEQVRCPFGMVLGLMAKTPAQVPVSHTTEPKLKKDSLKYRLLELTLPEREDKWREEIPKVTEPRGSPILAPPCRGGVVSKAQTNKEEIERPDRSSLNHLAFPSLKIRLIHL
jgi:hypothetical protein